MKVKTRMLTLPIIICTAILISSINSYAQWLPYTGPNFYDSLYGYLNQPYYEYGSSLPYGSAYPSYSLDSYYNFSSYTERYALSINQAQPSIIPYGALWQNHETYYLPYNYFGSHSWQIQLQDYPPYRPEFKNTDLTIFENVNRESNMLNPYSLNITNPYIVSGFWGWYSPGLFQSALIPTFMISVPRKPNHELTPSPENLFPDDIELPKQLTFSERDSRPYWSPDGNHIAFLSQRNTYNPNFSAIRFELWVMEKDGTNQRPIVSVDDLGEGSKFLHSRVSWAKNSNELLVSVYNGHTGEIWVVSLDGNISKLPTTDDWAGFALYSFDGTKIAFVVQETDPNIHGPIGKLYIANSDYSDHIFIDKGVLYDFSWKKDSQELIYSNKNDLWKYSLTENKKTQFSKTPEYEEYPSYSSDGKYIAFSDRDAVYITPAHTFQPKKLMERAVQLQWVPNRDLLVISCEQTLDNESFWTESWIIDLEGNVIKKITEGAFTELDSAPDGKHFVYSLNGNLWLDRIP